MDGKLIGSFISATIKNNGLSFVGAACNAGERIARIRITAGNVSLGAIESPLDMVAMDDFYFSEPRAMNNEENDFDGDGANDFSVFRPSNGYWYILQSSNSEFRAVQFGVVIQ